MSSSIQYASFLVRLWRGATTNTEGVPPDWHGEVEHIQSGERWTFGTLDELLDFMRQESEDVLIPASTLNE